MALWQQDLCSSYGVGYEVAPAAPALRTPWLWVWHLRGTTSMNAFQMIRRCKEGQWRGYSRDEQQAVDRNWEQGYSVYYPSLGHDQIDLWWVERDSDTWPVRPPHRASDTLMSIKVDFYPDDQIEY